MKRRSCAAVAALAMLGCLLPVATASAIVETHVRGVVTAADGGRPVGGARIDVFTSGGRLLDDVATWGDTAPDGTYDVELSRRSADNNYYVCVEPFAADLPPGSTGYRPACLGDVPYDSGTAAGDLVRVAPGTVKRQVNVHLETGAAVTVHIREDDGTPIPSAQIYVFPDGSSSGGAIQSDALGRATQAGLAPGAYRICSTGPPFGAPPGGYRMSCWRDAFWPGFAPTGQAFELTAGIRRVITFVLPRQGGISGRVTAQGSGLAVRLQQLTVFPLGGSTPFTGRTTSSGSYLVQNLPSGNYVVCAYGIDRPSHRFPTGLRAQCSGQVEWDESNAPPADAVAVHVVGGLISPGIDLSLPAGP